MKLVAAKELRYAGRSLKAGESFEASEKDAKVLKAIGKAKDPPRRGRPPKDGIAAETGEYLRRDMRAEE